MLILALDTTTRRGSLALSRDGEVLETVAADPDRAHATRLPGDILDCLARHDLALGDIDLFAVASGPGSFTGLRIGIATIQGLSFAYARRAAGISALDALAEAAGPPASGPGAEAEPLRAAWMDAQRQQVFGCLYRRAGEAWKPVEAPMVGRPEEVLAAWAERIEGSTVEFVGDGALAYARVIDLALGARARMIDPAPLLAPAIAILADRAASAGVTVPAAGIRPLYLRRPDVELARERRGNRAS
jgi:tRNA threonylcarbamoyladenosine biosynthesis protein TsaB